MVDLLNRTGQHTPLLFSPRGISASFDGPHNRCLPPIADMDVLVHHAHLLYPAPPQPREDFRLRCISPQQFCGQRALLPRL